MFDLSQINEEYLAKLKYEPNGKYESWPMAAILNDLLNSKNIIPLDLYKQCSFFSNRVIDNRYFEMRMPDYSIIVFGFRGQNFESRIFTFDARFLDRFYFDAGDGSEKNFTC